MESDVGCSGRKKKKHLREDTEAAHMLRAAGTGFTFGDFEFVVLLVPQAAPVAVGDPDRKLRVWAVRRLQGEVGGLETKSKHIKALRYQLRKHL